MAVQWGCGLNGQLSALDTIEATVKEHAKLDKPGLRRERKSLRRGTKLTSTPHINHTSLASSLTDAAIDEATTVLGSREEAMRWLGTPVRALDFATPVSLLVNKKGAVRVSDVLGQLAHGIW